MTHRSGYAFANKDLRRINVMATHHADASINAGSNPRTFAQLDRSAKSAVLTLTLNALISLLPKSTCFWIRRVSGALSKRRLQACPTRWAQGFPCAIQ